MKLLYNNAKVNPYQEIKFNTKDKLSLGDINNKIVFIENQEIKNSIFEQKVNNDIDKEFQKIQEKFQIMKEEEIQISDLEIGNLDQIEDLDIDIDIDLDRDPFKEIIMYKNQK